MNAWRSSTVENSGANPYGAPVADHEQRRDAADDQRRPPAVADGLAVDRAEPGDPATTARAG